MGFFSRSKDEHAEYRGVSDGWLMQITDTKLIMIALARFMEGLGIEDQALIDELYRRARLS